MIIDEYASMNWEKASLSSLDYYYYRSINIMLRGKSSSS